MSANEQGEGVRFTPGPWPIDFDTNSRDPDHPHHFFITVGGPFSKYASVSGHMGVANACLIAAAPDLLAAHLAWEAAEEARNDCNDYEDGCDNEGPWEACPLCSVRFGDAIDLRHAAIAKAQGPSS